MKKMKTKDGRMRGQSAVELALSLPILLVLATAVIDLGNMFYATLRLWAATREGARVASETSLNSLEEVVAAARTRTQRVLIDSKIPCCGNSGSRAQVAATSQKQTKQSLDYQFVRVQAQYQMEPLFPFWRVLTNSDSITLTAASQAYFDVQPVSGGTDGGTSGGIL